jgi:RHS repeat-associated protein
VTGVRAPYLYYDAHGNLAAEANTSGTLQTTHTYDPFGAPLDSVPSNTTIHRFVGRWNKQYDTTTGDILMGARPYDPTTGRFLSVDPIPGGSLNNYDYAGQDAINGYDINGTMHGEGADMSRECGSDWKSSAVRKCAFKYWLSKAYCARWKHDATCHSSGSAWLHSAWSWVKHHAADLAQAGWPASRWVHGALSGVR